jgi:four helix bundle protein
LIQQIRRSAVSVPANIAEGHERSTKEFIQYCIIAKGSLNETKYYIQLVKDLGYIQQEKFCELNQYCIEIGKMISGLKASLRTKK